MSFKPIATAVLISLALFLLLFMVWPKYQKLQDVNKQIKQVETQLEKNQDYVSRLEEFNSRLEDNQAELKKVKSSLPDDPKVPTFLNFINDTADDHGLLLKEVGSISRGSYKEGVKKINVKINLLGDYPSFESFAGAVDRSSRIIEFDNIIFRAPEEEGEPSQFEVKLSTHYRSE